MPECPHHLLSACSAARDGEFSIHVGCGAEESYLTLRNGKRAPIVNAGVLVLPPKSAPVLSASEPADASGAMLPQAVDGGTSKGTNVKGPILYTRPARRSTPWVGAVEHARCDGRNVCEWRAASKYRRAEDKPEAQAEWEAFLRLEETRGVEIAQFIDAEDLGDGILHQIAAAGRTAHGG